MSVSPSRTPDQIELNTISSIGHFAPKPFIPPQKKKVEIKQQETEFLYNLDGMKALQAKQAKLQKSVLAIENDIAFMQGTINRHKRYMKQYQDDHDEQVRSIRQQIENRKIQISKIDTSQEPPTSNQIAALVRQIQVEGMAAKRRAENCLHDQDVNIVLSGERLRKFHDVLGPRVSDAIFAEGSKLGKAYNELEENVYRTAEMQTQLRSLRVFSSNLDRRLVETNARLEALQFEKADVQMSIIDKKEELHAELTKRCEELGKLRWKIEYMKALKKKMAEPHFDVRKLDA